MNQKELNDLEIGLVKDDGAEADPRELTKELLEKALSGIVWKSHDGHYYCGIREYFDIDEEFEHALECLNGHFLYGRSILP